MLQTHRTGEVILSTLLFLLLGSSASATEIGVGGYVGYLVVPPRLEVDPGIMAGARLRYRWSESWGLELAGGISPAGIDPRLEVQYFFDTGSTVTPFFAFGPGLLLNEGSIGWLGDFGVGLDAELLKVMDLRPDIRMRVNGQDRSVLSVSATLGLQFHTPRIKDSDGDGVADDVDGCKEQAEDVDQFEDSDGCPEADNDKDGLLDAADRCPVEAEDIDQFEDSDGCLDADNDKDGVADTADTCAMNAEDMDKFEDSDGCPDLDNDKDGIPDEKDKAPDAAETFNGYQDRDGAPDEVPAEVKKFNGRIEGILFKTGSAEILPKSYTILDQAVAMLQQFPEIRMEIQGHTDDVGDDAKNLALSQERAQSVVNYMVSKGITADRLVAKGYGETTPEVPNDSETNQARNRRVEFHVIRENHENRRGDGK